MATEPIILITAAGGHIGSVLVPALTQQQVKLVLPTSNASRLQSRLAPTPSNVAVEEGSIRDPKWVQSIISKHKVNCVFLCLTSHDELIVALSFFDAMQRAGTVEHLVYVSALGDFATGKGLQNMMRSQSAMHVVVKATIEQKLMYGGYTWTWTLLGPGLFFANDRRAKESMLKNGFFPEPLGKAGVSRVSTDDIALAAQNVLLHPQTWAGRKIMLGSLRSFTGTEVATLWSQVLGREIIMEESYDHFEDAHPGWSMQAFGLDDEMSKAWERDMRLMFESFGEHGFGMTEEQYRVQVELLGKQPDEYPQRVNETGAGWLQA